MQHPWPFDQPPNCAVVSVREIIYEGAPILTVAHNRDDDGWQFLGAGRPAEAHAVLVALRDVVERDPSLYSLADLPSGWVATRKSASDQWLRAELT
jgi:hypothetical protein